MVSMGSAVAAEPVGDPPSVVSPYLSLTSHLDEDGGLREIRRDWDGGRLRAALEGLENHLAANPGEEKAPVLRFLQAELARRLRDTERSEAHLQQAGHHPAFADLAMMRIADIRRGRGDRAGAIAALGSIRPGSHLSGKARQLRGILLHEEGQDAEALLDVEEAIASALSREEKTRSELLRAEILIGMARKKEGIEQAERVWWQGGANQEAAEHVLSDVGASPDVLDHLLRDLLALTRYTVKKQKKGLRARLLSMRGAGNAALRNLGEALILMNIRGERDRAPARIDAALAKLKPGDRLHPWALYVRALALRRINHDVLAAEQYVELIEGYPEHRLVAASLHGAGRLLVHSRLPIEGKRRLSRLIHEHPGTPQQLLGLWELGWSAYLSDDPASSIPFFDQLARLDRGTKSSNGATWRERALYWRGRAERQSGQIEAALQTWSDLVNRHPMGYYAILAGQRLAGDGVLPLSKKGPAPPGKPVDPAFSSLRLTPHPSLQTAVELVRVGLFSEARSDLHGRLAAGELSPDGLMLLVTLYKAGGNSKGGYWVLRRNEHRGPAADVSNRATWLAARPVQFTDIARKHSRTHGIPASLALAIMDSESNFNPKAVSYAGAVGLMQVIPPLARTIAVNLLGLRPPRARDMKKPNLNVRVGTRFLSELLSLFRGNQVLAIAAYNAGSGAVSRWWRSRGHLATDEFLEEMPYRATAGYVRKVIAKQALYRVLHGSGEDRGPIERIEQTLPSVPGPFMVSSSSR
jgi:soluble lytic murein transglycosylase